MKIFYAVVLSGFLLSPAISQTLDIKSDSIRMSPGGERALVFLGKKCGLYDVSKKAYILEMNESRIFDFPSLDGTEIYARFLAGALQSKTFHADGQNSFASNDSVLFSTPSFDSYADMNGKIGFNGELVLHKNGKGGENLIFFPVNSRGLIRDGARLIVSDYDEFVTFLDSQDQWHFTPARCHTGLFDPAKKNWIIPADYHEIFNLNGYYFCSRNYETLIDEYNRPFTTYHYDIYDNSGKLLHDGITSQNLPSFQEILGFSVLRATGDDAHYIFEKDGKEGFLRFHIFNPYYSAPDFSYQIVESDKHDFLYYDADSRRLFALDTLEQNPISAYRIVDGILDENNGIDEIQFIASAKQKLLIAGDDWGFSRVLSDNDVLKLIISSHGVPLTEPDYLNLEYKEFNEEFSNYNYNRDMTVSGIAGYYHQFVGIRNSREIRQYDDEYTVKSLLYPGEDSIDASGNLVYFNPDRGTSATGVFNLTKNEWYVENRYHDVMIGPNGILLLGRTFNDNGERNPDLLSQVDFSLHSLDGFPDSLLWIVQELLKSAFTEYKVDSCFKAPNGRRSHLKLDSDYYYFTSGNKIGLQELSSWPGLPLSRNQCPPAEFVHYNPDLDFEFLLKGDSIIFEQTDARFAVSKSSELLVVSLGADKNGELQYALKVVSKGDTITLKEALTSDPDTRPEFLFSTIRLVNGRLLIRDISTERNSSYMFDEVYGNEVVLEYLCEAEASSLWESRNGAWKKVTPYYADLVPCQFGFIARSGRYYEDKAEYSFEGIIVTKEQADGRYFLLNKDLRALSFMDMYDFRLIEDLGFGISITTDKGSFFVTYTGKAITSDEWQRFELVDGKLKAIRDEIYVYDEFGEYVYDDEGNAKKISEAAEQIFYLED